MRVRLKGIQSGSFKRADGSTAKYFYAWKGGPRLNHADGSAITDKNDPAILVAFAAAHEAAKKKQTGNLFSLIAAFKGSDEFLSKADKTRADYARYIGIIENKFGQMPIGALEDKRARGVFKDWRDEVALKSGKRTADYGWTVLARILSCAKDRGKIAVNVCERGGRLYDNDRSDRVWADQDEAAYYAAAPSHMHLPLLMALWTGQREGDLLRITWLQYDGQYIRLEQRKGKKGKKRRVTIPVGQPLKIALDALKAKLIEESNGVAPDGPILRTMRGNRPWTEDGFRTSFGKACDAAGINDLTFHDARGTAVTRLALAGATVPEIATISGHSLKTVQEILDKHYLNRDVALADSAMTKLEASKGFIKITPMKVIEGGRA